MRLLCLCLSVWASPALAQTLAGSCDPKDAKDCVQPLLEGEKAPFSGQLLTYRRAARLAVEAGGCQDRLKLEVDFERELLERKVQYLEQLRESDADAAKAQVTLLQKRLQEAEDSAGGPWYDRPRVVAALTAFVTLGGVFLAIKAVQATR